MTSREMLFPERMDLTRMLSALRKRGCFPAVSCRAPGRWRACVNWSGNYWADGRNATEAMRSAMNAWLRAGRPMDGAASS